MLALNAHLRVWVAAEPADFRCSIDGLARRVRQKLAQDPFRAACSFSATAGARR